MPSLFSQITSRAMWLGVVLAGLVCGLRILLEVMQRRRRLRGKLEGVGGFPPGPFAWPIVGNLFLLLRGVPHQNLQEVAARYGPIVGLRFGQRQRALVVSSPDLAKQVLLSHDKLFADRPPFEFGSRMLFGSENGLLFTKYGQRWRKNRKLCTLQLFTTKRLQELHHLRHQEMHALLASLHRHSSLSASTPLDFGKSMLGMSSRLLLRMLYSRRTAHLDEGDLGELLREAEQLMSPITGDLIPSLSFLDFFKKYHMRRLHDRLRDVHLKMLKERGHSTSSHDDLLHGLLSDEEGFTEEEMYGILQDILGAGIHTTALTLEWAMAELLRNPCCFWRLRTELETQLDKKKQVSDEDLHKLTYVKWVVKETLRLHPVAPLLLPRLSMEECKLQGYTIPAKTLMFVNVWAIGRDEGVWPKANEFMPERFEGKDIEPKGQHFELLPFGAGRRTCLGMPMALPMIEVTLANLVKFFDWELSGAETCASINMGEKRGLTLNKATPLMVIPKPRFSFLET